jgi:hypothetical protein
MTLGNSKTLRGNEIYNIFEDYEGQISSDSEIEAKFYSIDSGLSHVDVIALGEVTVGEIDIKGEDERNEDFLWENISNYVGKREAFCNVSRSQSSAKDVSDFVECFELF